MANLRRGILNSSSIPSSTTQSFNPEVARARPFNTTESTRKLNCRAQASPVVIQEQAEADQNRKSIQRGTPSRTRIDQTHTQPPDKPSPRGSGLAYSGAPSTHSSALPPHTHTPRPANVIRSVLFMPADIQTRVRTTLRVYGATGIYTSISRVRTLNSQCDGLL